MSENAYFVEILRPADGSDCTLHGVSSRHHHATLYRDPPADVPEGKAAFVIVERTIGGKPYVHCQPVGESRWYMAGGNFVYTTDSRFRNEVCAYPIPVHDRCEGEG